MAILKNEYEAIVLDRPVHVTHNRCDDCNDYRSHPRGARFEMPKGTVFERPEAGSLWTSPCGRFSAEHRTVQRLLTMFGHVIDREQAMELSQAGTAGDKQAFGYFSFNFYNSESGEEQNHQFVIHVDLGDERRVGALRAFLDGESEAFDDLMDVMESDYGVHDVSAGAKDFFGYTSYEVDPGKFGEVMDKWKGFMESQGFRCGPVEAVSRERIKEEERDYPFGDAFRLVQGQGAGGPRPGF